jgi:16S rRNA (guanine(966)-N(2))-methyltransferase RsmD
MMGDVGKRNQHQVRIIAGRYKGRLLSYPPLRILRPTMVKTREALFSAIQDRLHGCAFVDLFSAAGGVGIEALSRGASPVHFVEREPEALKCLRANLDTCGVEGDRYDIHETDVERYLKGGVLKTLSDAIVFADPPYDSDIESSLLTHFRETEYENVLLFILEHRTPTGDPELGSLTLNKTRNYGDTRLTFWARSQ